MGSDAIGRPGYQNLRNADVMGPTTLPTPAQRPLRSDDMKRPSFIVTSYARGTWSRRMATVGRSAVQTSPLQLTDDLSGQPFNRDSSSPRRRASARRSSENR